MNRYMFTDTVVVPPDSDIECDNILGYVDCDIAGKDYEELIRLCCKYSAVFSAIVQTPAMKIAEDIEKFRIDRPASIKFKHIEYVCIDNVEPDARFYRVCPELCDFLINNANSIFQWINGWGFANPEDPTFYREDGSVLFTSVIHEGEVFLLPRDDEDVSHIVNNKYWRVIGSESIIQRQIDDMLYPKEKI